jgi:hypothetical protein
VENLHPSYLIYDLNLILPSFYSSLSCTDEPISAFIVQFDAPTLLSLTIPGDTLGRLEATI